MLCHWSTSSANAILRTVAHRSSVLHPFYCGTGTAGLFGCRTFHSLHSGEKRASFFTSSSTSGAAALASRPVYQTSAPLVDPLPSEDADPNLLLLSLTERQISRASAQAVRMSMQKGKFGDALYLIQSLLESHQPEHTASSRTKLIDSKSHASSLPIDFGQPVSPRLSAHAFLHGLVRAGCGKRAVVYVDILQTCGLKIRYATLKSIIRSLTVTSPEPLPLHSFREAGALRRLRKKGIDGEHVLKLRSSMISDTCTRAAIKLLLHARLTGERRMEQLYGTMINWLLLQGEIIVGSLLVVVLIKCFGAGRARAETAQTQADGDTAPLCLDGRSPFTFIRHDYSFRLSRTAVDTMNSVLREIDKAAEAPPSHEAAGDRLIPALQALANLAMLLDTGQLPTDRISTLIRTLYSCPKTEHYVWILDRMHKPVRVKAYPYFHNVLMRLIHSLTKPEPVDRPPPRLDTGSYNALLFYALRHRLSPALAADILDHMCCKREPPVAPNTVTYNTLVRAGTLMRRPDIADLALRALREKSAQFTSDSQVRNGLRDVDSLDVAQQSARPGVFRPETKAALVSLAPMLRSMATKRDVEDLSAPASRVHRSVVLPCIAVGPSAGPTSAHPSKLHRCVGKHSSASVRRESRVLGRLSREDWDVPERFFNARDVSIDAHTLASYVNHVTATGKPGIIAHVLFRMMPELAIVDHPTWGHAEDSQKQRQLSSRLRRLYLQRAVRFGPHLFSAVLNALAKTKMTGAAERVWLLAKQAEKASWVPNFVPDVEPWCLSVHAYTSMMRCYAEEAKAAISLGRREQALLDQALRQGEEMWVPVLGGVLPGWAAFVAATQKLRSQKYRRRRRNLRGVASLLHRCMVSAGLSLHQSLLAMAKTKAPHAWKGQFPLPDERFFNEALALFGRRFDAAPRARHTTPRFWRNQLTSAWHNYLRQGVKGEDWTAAMQEVAQSIVEAGLPVPSGFRANTVGNWDQAADIPEHVVLDRAHRPYAFPVPRTRFRAHAVVTVKTRGLPLPRNRRTRSCCRVNASSNK